MTAIATIGVAGAAALASLLGGVIALWRKPTTLFMSCVLGFAGGVLLATISFEMLGQALEKGSVPIPRSDAECSLGREPSGPPCSAPR